MTSQGQRFRRRALRRGYKVDEVDAFLDRVEATLSGEQAGPPVGAQEVHDVVFRVRFGGYDEWQVDLHLDRVERQLAELEDRGGRGAPAPDPMRDSLRGGLSAGSIGGGPKQGLGAAMSGGMGGQGMAGQGMGGRMAPPTERLPAPPVRDDRFQQQQPPARGPMQPDPYGRYDEPTGYGQPPQAQLPQRPPAPPPAYDRDPRGYDQGPGYDTGSFESPAGGFDGFEAGRHGKTDMTAEIRMPQADPRGGYGGPPPMSGPPMSGPPMGNAPMSGPPMGYGSQQPQLPPPMGEPGGELHRVDQLRRTFQPRRFGSGYDPGQVDRLFEGILQAMTGRGPMPVPENDLDMLQFGLVPGGYFEAEVDAALREVKDILTRRR
ncbi:DivIVA domain-containing protein [Actinoplanes sp. URMC 104]|uniref:DivIVA domain-containing protein n=1 Tax=Actinoplanes sp. URMC 104 TaxID=3423409 RepID=UPI003F1A74D5